MPRSRPLVVAMVVASSLLGACSGTQAPGAASGSPPAIAQSSQSAATPAATGSPLPSPGQLAACPTGPVTLETLIGLRDGAPESLWAGHEADEG